MGIYQNNKPFFLFLLKFGGSYLLLSVVYWLYLQQFDAAHFEPDGMTAWVSRQSRDLINFFGGNAAIVRHKAEASYRMFINGDSVARVIEGCNGISVMILFTAFITAFSSTFKKTFLYILIGIVTIHILNIIRIALICLGLYYYPQYGDLLHDVLFPLFIYGVVFVLWVLWVVKFSKNGKKAKA